MKEYDARSISLNPWPPLEHMADGRWKRVWRVHLKDDQRHSNDSMETLSSIIKDDILAELSRYGRLSHIGEDFAISLRCTESGEIAATIVMRRDGWSDDFYYVTRYLFWYIN